MSKEDKKPKVVVSFDDAPVLAELDLPALLKEYKANHTKEKFHECQVEYYKGKRDENKEGIKMCLEVVKADTILYTDSYGDEWKSTLVVPEAGQALDEGKLRDNMMRLGKLNAAIVGQIINASMVPTEAKKSYVLVTAPKEQKKGK